MAAARGPRYKALAFNRHIDRSQAATLQVRQEKSRHKAMLTNLAVALPKEQ